MKLVWSAILHGAVKLALYAADHPDQVLAVVQAVKTVKTGETAP